MAKEGGLVELRSELDQPVVLTGESKQRVVLKVTLTPNKVESNRERPPLNVSVVLDRSGSMQGEKIKQARQAALEILKRLDERDRISLVTYSDQARTDIPSMSANHTTEVTQGIQSVAASGSTALYAGVNQGAAEIRKGYAEGDYFHKLILLSDGMANIGPKTPTDLELLGRALGNEGMSVCTVGLGAGYNEDLMVKLAMATQSQPYYVAEAKSLPEVFASEIGDALNMVGKSAEIRIQCSPGVWPVRSIGLELGIEGSEATGEYRLLYSGKEKYVMLELEVAPFLSVATRELARVTTTYQDMIYDEVRTLEDTVSLRFAEDQEEVDAAWNLSVAQAIAYQEIAA
ncbi:MAG: VWA domain-containing protein, partial [Verrucomicrobiota bacterium]